MKFGIYSSIANPPRGENLDRSIDEVIAEAQLAEASGFDSCFFGEHHQDKDGFLPSPLIVATAVAARTQTLRVGTSVILLPLYHPVRVAEDAITLDLVSKGRVVLVGDASHASSPNMAEGASMAMEDALVLAECLATNGDVPAALEAYRARRAARVGHVQATTHRRDRLRYLHPLARRAIMRVAGHRVFRAHYRQLLAPP